MICSLKYFSVFIPQKSCISLRLLGVEQNVSRAFRVSSVSFTSVLTSVLTSVVPKSVEAESGPTFVVDISFRGKLQYRYSAQM